MPAHSKDSDGSTSTASWAMTGTRQDLFNGMEEVGTLKFEAGADTYTEVRPGIWCDTRIAVAYRYSRTFIVHAAVGAVNGVIDLTELSFVRADEGPSVSADLLREFPTSFFRDVLRGSVKGARLYRFEQTAEKLPIKSRITVPEKGVWAAKYGPNPESLEAVAAIYEIAEILGLPPTNEVAAYLDLTRPTAGRWVSRARKMELIPPTGTKPEQPGTTLPFTEHDYESWVRQGLDPMDAFDKGHDAVHGIV